MCASKNIMDSQNLHMSRFHYTVSRNPHQYHAVCVNIVYAYIYSIAEQANIYAP